MIQASDPSLPEGWLSDDEAAWLMQTAANTTVLEVGAWFGRSTVALASTARLVVSVDHHMGPPYDGQGSTLSRFLANLEDYGVRDRVVPFIAGFEVAGPLLRREFDLVFIDGAHDLASCLRDGHLGWQVVKVGGVLVFHDYYDFATGGPGQDGVREAVDELCDHWGVKFENPAGSLAVVRRKVV